MSKNRIHISLAFITILVVSATICAQARYTNASYAEFAKVSSFVKGKQFALAESELDKLLRVYPNNINLLLLRSVALSRQKKHYRAEYDLRRVLRLQPGNVNALLVLAYNYAWTGNYTKAEAVFRKVLRFERNNLAASRGLSNVLIWKSNVQNSLVRFEILEKQAPDGSEILSNLSGRMAKKARAKQNRQQKLTIRNRVVAKEKPISTVKNLRYEPRNEQRKQVLISKTDSQSNSGAAAKTTDFEGGFSESQPFVASGQTLAQNAQKLKDTKSEPLPRVSLPIEETPKGLKEAPQNGEYVGYKPRIDFTILGGYTRAEIEGVPGTTSKTGVRFLEIAVEPVRKTRFWFQFDNGLSLDNPSLARTNERAPTYWFGGLVNYKRNYLTKFAYGRRNLPGDISQNLFDVEQVFFLPRNYSFNIGATIAPRSDDRTEFIFRSGVGVPVGENLRLEPTFFYSQSGFEGERQFRVLLAGDYTFDNGFKIGGGFAAGKSFRPSPLTDDNITDVFFRTSAPAWKYFRPQFIVRREDVGNTNTTVVSFGFTVSNKELK